MCGGAILQLAGFGSQGRNLFLRSIANKVTGVTVARPNRTASVQTYIPEIATGLGITMKHVLQNTQHVAVRQRPALTTEATATGITRGS